MTAGHRSLEVPVEAAGVRLDVWLAGALDLPRTKVKALLDRGAVRIVLYDARASSPTHGQLNEFSFGEHRPALLMVPPGVWHGVENLRHEPSALLNLVDEAYSYDDPDHWRLPVDSPRIPFSFGSGPPSS